MGIRNRKGVLRSLIIGILGYGGDFICALRAALAAVRDGVRAQYPDEAKKEFKEMDP
ncbi:MAG: hypothetical protein M0P64_00230 [Candidatus Pacebacteria bacterium]|jgi:hypothetical protein|nr:hypothetical protein [Candidatus Paceibacterota bacterium]